MKGYYKRIICILIILIGIFCVPYIWKWFQVKNITPVDCNADNIIVSFNIDDSDSHYFDDKKVMDLIFGALETDSWKKCEKRIEAASAMEYIIITFPESSYIIEILKGKGNQLGFCVTGDMYGTYIHPHYVTDSISYSELIGRLKAITSVFKKLDRSNEQDFAVKEKKENREMVMVVLSIIAAFLFPYYFIKAIKENDFQEEDRYIKASCVCFGLLMMGLLFT